MDAEAFTLEAGNGERLGWSIATRFGEGRSLGRHAEPNVIRASICSGNTCQNPDLQRRVADTSCSYHGRSQWAKERTFGA